MKDTTSSSKSQIIRKLEDIISSFGKEIFNENKKASIELKNFDKIVFGNVYIPAFYKDKKIYVREDYLNLILNNYKNTPELIKELMRNIIHEYVHVLLDTDLEKEEVKKNIIAHEGLATLIGNIYAKIISKYSINPNKNIEEILEEVNNYVIEKFKDKEYLKNLENELKKELEKEINEKLIEVLEKYKECTKMSYDNLRIFDLYYESKYLFFYYLPSLMLQKRLGILKILEDLSLGKASVEEYTEIISEEYENLEEKNLIISTLDCLEDKLTKYLEYIEKYF
ncbi:MAG: hypothetical protein QW714_02465 [Nanopusillaceae archaeon]